LYEITYNYVLQLLKEINGNLTLAPPSELRGSNCNHESVTNKQTKKLNVCGCHGGGRNPSPTKLGMVIEDLEHVLTPRKLFRVRCI